MSLKIAKLCRHGRRQTVQLPREFRFEGDHVYVKKSGNGILLLPAAGSCDSLIGSLTQFSANFMEEREQPLQQRR